MKKGPGQELREIFASIGIKPKKTCKCSAITQWMDEIGVDGCKRDRNAIVREICAGIKNYSASEVAYNGCGYVQCRQTCTKLSKK